MKKVLLSIVLTVCAYQMYAYKPGTYLLDSRNPDYNVMWGQGVNDKKGCHPSYNYFCPNRSCCTLIFPDSPICT